MRYVCVCCDSITTDTEVQRMIREEEGQARGQRGGQRGKPDTSVYQSPSVRHLESQLGVVHKDGGISDF